MQGPPAAPQATTIGRVAVIAWPEQAALAAGLAEAIDHAPAFPGVGLLPDRPIRLVLAPTRTIFDSLTRRRMPAWSEGAAFPDLGTVVLLSDRPAVRLSGALRHELAHVALRWRVGRRLPLWFEEGYAAYAAAEWGRLDALRLNWQIARGVRMDLDQVDRALRGDAADAGTAYALATTAVLLLDRWGRERGLTPLIQTLAREPGFDAALRATYHVTAGDFEARWQREVASRYGWLAWAGAVGLFWAAAGTLMVILVTLRRRRDRVRKAGLDEGWTAPSDDTPTA
ncbi:MAG: hypothetical protein HYS40_03855 [Gemmatimonadetes bacterium]|nr:hypothetical protein [Gemmatimonadota bacterium]